MKILAIDDNQDNLTALAAVLRGAFPECALLTALSGSQGLELAGTEDPDVILLDMVMPGMDGFQVCRQLKADSRLRDIPVVFVTALGTDRQSHIQALEVGAEAFLVRPLNELEVLVQVRAMSKLKAANRLQRLEKEQLANLVTERTQQLVKELTERRHNEESLRASEERFKAITAVATNAILLMDDKGRIVYWNPAAERIFGYSSDEALGKDLHLFLAPERLHGTYQEGFARFVATGKGPVINNTVELAAMRKGGTEFPIEVSTSAMNLNGRWHAVGIVRDITERKRSEEKVREQAALLDQTNDAILVRTLDGTVTYWNRGAERMFGWTSQEMLGRSVHETMVPAAAREKLKEIERQALAQGYAFGEMNYVSKTGRTLSAQTRSTSLRDAAGTPQSYLVLITDLTEQKNLEAQFLRAQRLEALGTLASGIAHDLNNILAPIRMVAPFLREAQTPAEIAENVDLIESSTQRASDVVRQLLAFGRGGSGERMALQLKHLLRELRHVILETFPKNIIFIVADAPDLWPLVADPTQLHQVLLNLCINARDAMPEGGTLKLTAVNFSADEHFAGMVAGARPGAYVLLQVSDTGTGIHPEHLDKIFDPFFTTKEEGRGTGLGLAVVYKVATSHGGFVQVRSQVGKGTTFEVYLPASPATLVHDEPALPCSLLDGHGELILVVDDEETIRQITEKTLERHGYRVLTAKDGTEAVVLFAPRQQELKAVVTDLMMPGMDGLELVKVLAELAPTLPVVVSTGAAGGQVLEEKLPALRQLGVRHVLTKPYTTEQLLKALHDALFPIE